MKAVRIHEFGGPGVMRIDTVDPPQPGRDELLLRMHAASTNPVDYKMRAGMYPPVSRDKLPVVLGRDVSGVVERAGPGVQSFRQGDGVFAMLAPDRGAFAEFVIVKESETAPKPTHLSHAQAAAVPLAALTAWQGLIEHGGLSAGQCVLIHGGAGGVGHFAIQIAKAKGATVATTVSGGDMEFARQLGADQAIDYEAHKFEELVRDVDVVFDLVAGETQERSWGVLKRGGILVSTLGRPPEDEASQYGVRAAGFMARPNGSQLAEIGRLIDAGKIRPVVAAIFPLAEAQDAERRLEQHHVSGKIVLELAA
jgi:NADPH:quinone reductase-like Zn-dependent oxidoreductase